MIANAEPTAVVRYTISDHRVCLGLTGRTIVGEYGSAAAALALLIYRRGTVGRWYLVEARINGELPWQASLGRYDEADIAFHAAYPEYGTVPGWLVELVAEHKPTQVPA